MDLQATVNAEHPSSKRREPAGCEPSPHGSQRGMSIIWARSSLSSKRHGLGLKPTPARTS
eukprot:7513984-Pyramimonas_sp.AAC.1